MKKINHLFVLLCSPALFAQNGVTFDKKISYKIEVDQSADMDEDYKKNLSSAYYNHFLAKNDASVGILNFGYSSNIGNYYDGSDANYLIQNNQITSLFSNGISGKITYQVSTTTPIIDTDYDLVKLDRKGNFNGFSCNYYSVVKSDRSVESDNNVCLCIDETNKVNNLSNVILNTKIKGLIIAVEPSSSVNDFKIIIDKVENANLKLDLDIEKIKKEIATYEIERNAADTIDYNEDIPVIAEGDIENNMYSDPLMTYDYNDGSEISYDDLNFITPIYSSTANALYRAKEYNADGDIDRKQIVTFYKKEFKSLVKNLTSSKLITKDQKKSLNNYYKNQLEKIEAFKPNQPNDFGYDYDVTAAAVDSIATDYAYAADFYNKYESTYKDIKVSDISLAYDILEDDTFKEFAPNYCDQLKEKVPNFQSKELKLHVYNYAGQICDLYLYNNGGNVDYFTTINEMRASLLAIEKLRSNLSQSDQKLLLEFLKNLD